jgi:hypothetical protein
VKVVKEEEMKMGKEYPFSRYRENDYDQKGSYTGR